MTNDQIFASPSSSPSRKHSRRTSKKEHASKNVERGASRSRASLDRKRSRVHDEFGSQDAFVKEWGMTPEEEVWVGYIIQYLIGKEQTSINVLINENIETCEGDFCNPDQRHVLFYFYVSITQFLAGDYASRISTYH